MFIPSLSGAFALGFFSGGHSLFWGPFAFPAGKVKWQVSSQCRLYLRNYPMYLRNYPINLALIDFCLRFRETD